MVCSATRVCVVDEKNFLDTMRHEHVCFAIVPKYEKTKVEEVPIEVANFLEEFLDFVSNTVPDGLPLV